MSTSSPLPLDTHALTITDCLSAGYGFNRSFHVAIENNQTFFADEVARVLPRKRMVAFGSWQGRPAVIKLFFDRQHATRHCKADSAGMKVLHANNIPAPALVYEGYAKDKRMHVLIYERVQDALSLHDLWRAAPDVNALEETLQRVVLELATQHVLGVLQKDCHLNNFLLNEKQVITLDGGQITVSDALIPKAESMENLALFFSQLGAGTDALCVRLFQYYAKARGWLLKKEDTTDLLLSIKKFDAERWMQFDKKLTRSSSMHVKLKTLTMQGMVERRFQTPAFLEFMKTPDAVFARPDAMMLKNGRSSTVIQITLDGETFVIKRYNLKHLWHRVRRAFRVTRAFSCWRLAHKLQLFHVATAKPVAYLEARVLGLRGRSYFVMSCVPGVDVGVACQGKTALDASVRAMAPRVAALMTSLKGIGLTHGDLKKTNILINSEGYPVFIDLDGAREHTTLSGLKQSWRAEVKRFLANFEAQPTIKALFKALLGL